MNEGWLWHKRLGHLSFDSLVKINRTKVVRDMPKISKPTSAICECQHGKHTGVSLKSKECSTSRPIELVHTYLCGPTRTPTLLGERYSMLFIDDYTRMVWVSFLKEKSEALDTFKSLKALVENESDLIIKCRRSYIGGDFAINDFLMNFVSMESRDNFQLQ